MKKKLLLLGVALVVAGTALFLGLRFWRASVVERQEQRAYARAKELVTAGRCADGLAVLRAQARPDSKLPWPELEVAALVGVYDLPRLTMFYEQTPGRILSNEVASVLVSRAFVHTRRAAEMAPLRAAWNGREQHPELWLILDADALTIAGKPREAEKLLRSRTLPGKDDAARLARLAILVAPRDLNEAWRLLDQASALDPRSADLRSFRGQMLETVGRYGEARVEYVAALVADPQNTMLRDQLAEFYQRRGLFDLALQTWEEGLANSSFDFPWVKVAFWSRVIQPLPLDAEKVPPGDLQPLARWLIALPAGVFWNSNTFNELPQANRYAKDRQELFWLHLLGALQTHQEAAATELLDYDRFRLRSWDPDLVLALRRILHYRQKRSLNPPNLPAVSAKPATNQHQFLVQLSTLAAAERSGTKTPVPPDYDALLRGPDAFTAAFLAAGWRAAALDLHPPTPAAVAGPDWLAYGLAQALRMNRGNRPALDFIAAQKPTPELELLAAEILIAENQTQTALDRLAKLAVQPNDAGYRASYLLALANLELNKLDEARRWITQHPGLAADVTGKELIARITMLQGQEAQAAALYRAIANESIEAKTYLARKAFANKQWAEARRYTQELIKLLPDELKLRENLLAIEQAEAGK